MASRIRSLAKRGVVALALWGLIRPELAQKIIERMKWRCA